MHRIGAPKSRAIAWWARQGSNLSQGTGIFEAILKPHPHRWGADRVKPGYDSDVKGPPLTVHGVLIACFVGAILSSPIAVGVARWKADATPAVSAAAPLLSPKDQARVPRVVGNTTIYYEWEPSPQ